MNAISSLLLWFVLTAVLLRTKRPVWYPYLGSWLITLACEITILGLFTSRHAIKTAVPIILVIIEACRILALLLLLATHTTSQLPTQRSRSDEESASLLKHKTARTSGRDTTTQPANGYGSVTVADGTHAASTDTEDSESESPADEESKKRRQALAERLKKDGNWFTYFKGFSVFIPMIWPSQQPKLYLNMVGCGLCILCDRFLKFLVPYQLGVIVNILTSGTGALYTAIGLYAVARWAASGSFGLDILRRWLWQPIERYSKTAITTAAYNQIMELSSDFHDNKRSGELYQAITQGSSVTELLEMVLFDLGPMLIDVVVGFVYLYYLFGPYMALLALATTCAYLVTATHFNARQSGVRRDYQDLSRKRYQVMYDTVGSWATVSYFNRIPYEKGNYKKAVTLYMATQQRYFRLSYLYNSISISTMDLGLCGALLLAAYQVKHGTHPVGDFVVLLSYWSIYTGLLPLLYSLFPTIPIVSVTPIHALALPSVPLVCTA